MLPSPLQARARNAANTGTAFNTVSGSPLNLLAWAAPISNDAITLEFAAAGRRQRRAAHRHLREDADLHAVDHDAVDKLARTPPLSATAAWAGCAIEGRANGGCRAVSSRA